MVSERTKLNFYKTTAATGEVVIDLREATTVDENNLQTAKYKDVKNLKVINVGNTQLKIWLNQKPGYDPIPNGTIFSNNDSKIETIKIKNLSSTTAAEYYITIDGDETELSVLKDINNKPARLLLSR